MYATQTDLGYLIRLEKDEPVMEALRDFVKRKDIPSGILSGIGAVKNSRIGYYDLAKKKYFDKMFPEEMELTNLSGNIAWHDGEPVCHCHCTLSDTECRAFAGHLFEATTAITVEIWLQPSSTRVLRAFDPEVGLNLIEAARERKLTCRGGGEGDRTPDP